MEGRCTQRTGHVAVCLDNYLLVWGGYNEMNDAMFDHYLPREDLWVYNTETKTWQKVKLKSHTLEGHEEELPYGTSGAAANILNGYLYVFGGHNIYGTTNHIMRLNLRGCQWEWIMEDVSSLLPSPRDKHASWVYEDKLYYFGGYGESLQGYLKDNGEFLRDASAYLVGRGWNNQLLAFDTCSNTWSNPKCKGDVPSARAAHDVTRVGKVVFLYGGRHLEQRLGDLYQLDLNTYTWNQILNLTSPHPVGRSWHTLSTVTDSLLFLYGGYTQDNKPLDDAWIFNINTMQWCELHLSQKQPRLWHTTCVTNEEDILVFGGCSNNILEETGPITHCNDVLEFRVSPKALLKLCMDAVFNSHTMCEPYWDYLPKHLSQTLRTRLEAFKSSTGLSKAHGDGINGEQLRTHGGGNVRGQTCALS